MAEKLLKVLLGGLPRASPCFKLSVAIHVPTWHLQRSILNYMGFDLALPSTRQ